MINLYCIRPKGFNIGNDVIHLALNHFLRSAFDQPVNIISLPATSKYESQKKAGLNSQTIYEINQFGNGLIIGGGNLYENNELEINPTALKALEVPMMLFSLSRGRIYNKNLKLVDRTDVMTDKSIKILNEKAQLSLSRDKATWEYIKSLGVDNTLAGCPTLFMNEIPQHLIPISESSRTDALISVRTPTLMSIPVSQQYNVRDIILELIKLLNEKGYHKIRILCHDHRDISFAASFRNLEYLYTDDVYAYLTYLRNTQLNLTFRLHSFLPAIAYDVPAIKISYDERALSMLDTIGLDEWNINYLTDNVVDEVKKRLESIEKLESLKKRLRASLWKELRETLVMSFSKFANLVK
jgi:polysaccharide pyruvyl transferase WcaK-like protein